MEIKTTDLPGVLLLKPRRFADARGYFVETYNQRVFEEAGVKAQFIQDNQSFSVKTGTIRGLHFQVPPDAQTKLVRASRGKIFDVAVDLRLGSPTYGRWIGAILTADAGEQLLIPRGFAHGFCTLEPDTEVSYKVDAFYSPKCDGGIIWSDPTFKIDWPLEGGAAVLSDKDAKLGLFQDFATPFRYEGGPA